MNANKDALYAAHSDESIVPYLKAVSFCSYSTDVLFPITVKLTTASQLSSYDASSHSKMTAFSPALHECISVLQAVCTECDWPRSVCHALRATR